LRFVTLYNNKSNSNDSGNKFNNLLNGALVAAWLCYGASYKLSLLLLLVTVGLI